MITTVTLSPCIDKTVTVRRFDPKRMNRVESSRLDAGGKGINVCLALAALEIKSRAVYMNFDGGDIIGEALDRAGVEAAPIKCPGRIRTNLKIYDEAEGNTIELNEQNPPIPQKALLKLTEIFKNAAVGSRVVVLSGSVPAGVPKDIYKQLSLAARQANSSVKIVLDSEGEPFLEGLSASPCLVKPNIEELERTFGVKLSDDGEIAGLARDIIKKYSVETVLVSLGAGGAMAVTEKNIARVPALGIVPKSAQGAGDAMVAGACLAIMHGMSASDIVRCGSCVAAGAVELEGTAFCTRERFEELYSKF